ncbi:hypothetical protein BDR26DRAFT_864405 [Obelidium mucronatum]|nr:hypothetical protein BDR26DRAFT_864405 [Obelidium mucronatum]
MGQYNLAIPLHTASAEPQTEIKKLTKFHGLILCSWLAAAYFLIPSAGPAPVPRFRLPLNASTAVTAKQSLECTQLPQLIPSAVPSLDLSRLDNPGFTKDALSRFSRAIQIPTESYDIQPPGKSNEDVAAPFLAFHKTLELDYPLIHQHLSKRVLGKHSLLFTWEGTAPDRDALILMAHIDVVPVLPETRDQWTHAPYSGAVDYKQRRVWGRGASDTKATLVAVLEAVEQLLAANYVPQRTLYLAFGDDEESNGKGAFAIAQYLQKDLKLAGKIGLIVDEGSGLMDFGGLRMAHVCVSEKGYADVEMVVETKGGHSSVPPKHTGIGLSSMLITALESNPQEPQLSLNNPIVGSMACIANHAPNPDPAMVKAIKQWPKSRKTVLKRLIQTLPEDLVTALLVSTQAVDIINGGLKVNALPEKVTTIINHRIGAHDSPHDLQSRYRSTLLKLTKKLKLNLTITEFKDPSLLFHESTISDAVGKVTIGSLSPFSVLEPSPVSPYNTAEDNGWAVLEGTIHYLFDTEATSDQGNRVIVGPMFAGGNTDTKSYWGLSKSIYRFSPGADGEGAHTVNEWVSMDTFLKSIKFYHELIRNWSEQ